MSYRECYWTDESYATRLPNGQVVYRVIRVVEGRSGYYDSVVRDTLAEAQGVVTRANESLGLTQDDVDEIRLSSMRASR